MRKILFPFLLLVTILLAVWLRFEEQKIIVSPKAFPRIDKALVKKMGPPEPVEPVGEKIVYTVKLGKVSLGAAYYTHLPKTELHGTMVSLMTFETRLVRFRDRETIYSDSRNFFPLKVERSISTWPNPENISEEYDQKNFTLTIVKKKGKTTQTQVIKNDGPIQNAILLPFSVRRMDGLSVGWSMRANLPNQQFEITLASIEDVKVPAGSFKAYHFTSVPERFEIWISADERKIPLKIMGAGALGYTLLMKEYSR